MHSEKGRLAGWARAEVARKDSSERNLEMVRDVKGKLDPLIVQHTTGVGAPPSLSEEPDSSALRAFRILTSASI